MNILIRIYRILDLVNLIIGLFDENELDTRFIKTNIKEEFTAKEKPKTEWFIKGTVPSKKNSRQNFVSNGKQISLPSKKHQE